MRIRWEKIEGVGATCSIAHAPDLSWHCPDTGGCEAAAHFEHRRRPRYLGLLQHRGPAVGGMARPDVHFTRFLRCVRVVWVFANVNQVTGAGACRRRRPAILWAEPVRRPGPQVEAVWSAGAGSRDDVAVVFCVAVVVAAAISPARPAPRRCGPHLQPQQSTPRCIHVNKGACRVTVYRLACRSSPA